MRGGTRKRSCTLLEQSGFQSTLPVRGGTFSKRSVRDFKKFQSTLPVRGGTNKRGALQCGRSDFNPPSPCGEGPSISKIVIPEGAISIHPPRAGRDAAGESMSKALSKFQSTLPVRGGTLTAPTRRSSMDLFQSTLPVRGGTAGKLLGAYHYAISIHPPRAGRDVFVVIIVVNDLNFNPPSPCGEGRRHLLPNPKRW